MSVPIDIKVQYAHEEAFVETNTGSETTSEKIEYHAYLYEGVVYTYATLFDADSNNTAVDLEDYPAPAWLERTFEEMRAEHEPV